MRGIAASAALAAMMALGSSGAALAQSDTQERDVDACSKISDGQPRNVIAACGRLLADPEVRHSWNKQTVAAIYGSRAFAYRRLRNYQAALNDLRLAIELAPTYHFGIVLRGRVYADMGNHHAAIADFTRCLRLRPRDDICFQFRGSSNMRLRNYAQALRDLNMAIGIEPTNAAAHGIRGVVYDNMGQRQAAIRDYRKAVQLGVQSDVVQRRLAELEAGAPTGPAPRVAATPQPPQRAAPAPGTPVNFTWRFRNNTGGTVHVKMYARERRNWWPGASTNWRMDGVGPYAFTISCRYGEKVCYGAWQSGNTDRYWGVGFQDAHGCQNCCYACRQGQTTQYNLNP